MNFSDRADWDRTMNDLARCRAEMAAAGEAILDLTESNPTRCGFDYPAEEILRALSDPAALTYDPDPRGLQEAREEIAAAMGPPADLGRVILSSGTSESYAWIFKLLCNPGDTILVPSPSYPLFEYLARMEGIEIRSFPLRYDGRWTLSADDLARTLTPGTRAVVAVQPNNPTGSYLDAGEIAALVDLCRDRGAAILSDEVFFDYPVEIDPSARHSLAGIDGVLTFVLGGLSKLAGLPQVKLAWILAGGPRGVRDEALDRLELIADTYLSVGTAVQRGAAALLRAGEKVRAQIRARLLENRGILADVRGSDAPWDILRIEGGWSAVLRVPDLMSDGAWALRFLREDRALVHPGELFDFDRGSHIVVSLLPRPDRFREGIERIAARIAAIAG